MITINMTPKWADLLPAFLAMIEDGTPEARTFAVKELERALTALDTIIEQEKAK